VGVPRDLPPSCRGKSARPGASWSPGRLRAVESMPLRHVIPKRPLQGSLPTASGEALAGPPRERTANACVFQPGGRKGRCPRHRRSSRPWGRSPGVAAPGSGPRVLPGCRPAATVWPPKRSTFAGLARLAEDEAFASRDPSGEPKHPWGARGRLRPAFAGPRRDSVWRDLAAEDAFACRGNHGKLLGPGQ
jgi:hypothetical protein